MFRNCNGGRLSNAGVHTVIADTGRKAGIEGLHPHMLRHYWAHVLMAAGIAEHDLMKLAGWTSTTMLKTYGAAMAEQRAVKAGRALQVSKLTRAG